MNLSNFLIQLGVLTVSICLVLLGFNMFPQYKPLIDVAWIAVLFFLCFNIVVFFIGKRLAVSADKYAFSRFVLGSMVLKMALTVVIVLAYNNLWQPASKYFVFPFIFVYIAFTIFETYFLMLLSKEKAL